MHRIPQVDTVDLNTKRPLFASRRMRRAVNYAVDRRALAARGGTYFAKADPADMYLPPGVPGFRETTPIRSVPTLPPPAAWPAAPTTLPCSTVSVRVVACAPRGSSRMTSPPSI